MAFIMYLVLTSMVFGFVVIAANPSPFFGALGLVMLAGTGCGILSWYGGSFLSLVLFLIYLGGMLVVFAYSAALAADPFPESLGSRGVLVSGMVYLAGVVGASVMFWGGWYESSWVVMDESVSFSVLRGDMGGVALMYSWGGGMLVLSGGALLLALFVVLELTRGKNRGALRSI
uniref:NADH-ubiquinone oxidoreductase chain 6 n=1 Tax=Solea ovata TaxID=520517 RepID=A0A068LEG9_9PLEU|nr:NADH dehydrogenase subunit 6 [Solea ovata]AHZ34275.1 NADH dehydrogenase subunit 6 [Solea ovata]AIE44652.1 NADH dehydrogenase subunit 6 [Solea ovata]